MELNNPGIAPLPGVIVLFDSSGCIKLVNPTIINLVGHKAGDNSEPKLMELPPFDEIIRERAGSFSRLMELLAHSDEQITWRDIEHRDNGGKQRCLHISIARMTRGEKEAEHTKLFLLIASDASDRIRSEQFELRMEQTQRLAVLGEMMAGLAHEINNPLSVISGNAQLMASAFLQSPIENMRPDDWKELHECARSIEIESERCCKLVSDFLQLSRRPRPGNETRSVIYLNRLLSDLLRIYRSQLDQNRIRVVKDFDRCAPQVWADPDQIHQVFVNLISNACQVMPRGGTLELQTKLDKNMTVTTIRDTGPGVPNEHAHRIFDPFFTTKPPGEGTGLGLSIANSIVLRHDGTLTMESVEGQGATFCVTLPQAEVSRAEESAPAMAAQHRKRG